MRNFLAGLLLGALAMYWYVSHGGNVRAAVSEMWAEASRAPAVARSHR